MILEAIWDEFLKIVRQEAGSRVVETWLKAVTLNHWDALERIIYLKAPNVFVKDWITSNYLTLFQIHLSRLLNVNSLKIIFIDGVHKEVKKENTELIPAIPLDKPQSTSLIKKRTKKRVHLNKNYQFNTFVIGPSNQLAYAASYAVTEQLGTLYNPLFIYGDSGLGKTHLLQAIANDIKAKDKKILHSYLLYVLE